MNSTATLSRAARTAVVGFVFAIASLVGLSLAGAASAAPNYPPSTGCTVGTIGTTASIGTTVGISGSGFESGSTVTLTQNPGGQKVGSATAGADGTFTTTVTVSRPDVSVVASSGSQSCGTSKLGTDSASDQRSNGNANAPTETASTGFQSLTATAIAAALLLGGLAFIMAGRRRAGRSS